MKIAPDLDLPIDAATGTFGILATRGAGKSNAAVVMAEEMYDAGIPFVAIDPKGDWWGIRSSADGKAAGLPVVVFGGRHGDVPLEPTAGQLLAALVLDQRLSCVLDVSQFTKADTTRFLLAFGRHLFTHADDDGAEPLHLFLEEAHEYLPQQVKGDQAELVNVWQRIVKQGRFKGLGCTMISQRSSVLNKDVLELVDSLVVLRTVGPLSRNAIKGWVAGQDVDPGLLDSLPTLKSGDAWVWSPGELGIMQRIHFRRRRTFDSGATPKVGEVRRQPSTIADVDLAAIKEQMADTIEKAKADDPKELRKRIRDLEHQLAARPAETVEVERVVEVPVVPLEIVGHARRLREQLGQVAAAIADILAIAHETADTPPPAPTPTPRRVAAPTPARTAPPPPAGDTTIGKGERTTLIALVQHGDRGCTREQLTVLTSYKRSTRNTYLQRLTAAGLATESAGRFHATPHGVDVIGDAYEQLPTGRALLDHHLATLPAGEAATLRVIADHFMDGLTREAIQEATGYKRSTSNTYIQRLNARELVDVTGSTVLAAELLFD